MATELTPLEDAAALIALQLTEHYLQSHGLGATAIVEAFNEIYWGVLQALNPNGWASTESDARASQEGAERSAEPK